MIDFVSALVGSMGIGMTFFLSPVAGILTDQIGIRMTTFLGGTLAIGGLVLSSFFSNNVNLSLSLSLILIINNNNNNKSWIFFFFKQVEVLYVSFGIILGVGASLAYSPSLIILGHYFTKYLGVANGFATAGSSVFTLAFPYFLQALIDNFELKGCFLGVSFLMILILGNYHYHYYI